MTGAGVGVGGEVGELLPYAAAKATARIASRLLAKRTERERHNARMEPVKAFPFLICGVLVGQAPTRGFPMVCPPVSL
jgi:hypothetical protein